jgi:hypothetical protein
MTDDLPDGVLAPADLELDDDRVRPIADGRYVVSTDGGEGEPATTGTGADGDRDAATSRSIDEATSDPALDLDDLDGAYALAVRARTEGVEDTVRVGTDDVSATFEGLLRWYAARVSADVPAEEVVSVLLANSTLNLDVRRS